MSLSDSDSKPVETTKQPTSKPGDVATYEKTNPLIRVLVSILTFGLNNNAISAKESEFRPQSPSPEARRTIGSKQDEDQGQVQVQDQNDLISVLERDYANEYFLTGAITDAAYEPDCLFVDPTVTIRGLSKWKQSIGNLGYFFLTEVIDARTDTEGKSQGKRKQRLVLKDIEMKDNAVYTRWVLDVLLKLPWKPRVQVFGTTIHSINARTKRIQRHEERWTTSVPAAFRQLFTPSQQGEGTKSRGISSQGREQ